MTTQLDREIERLRALKQVNPSVRDEEIELLVGERRVMLDHLANSRIRLDAIRLIHRCPA